MTSTIERVAALLREVAAEEIIPRFRALAEADKRRKPGGELVTVVDEAVEARLAPILETLVPGSIVVGEEGTAADPDLLRRLDGEDRVWVIDPVDGTENFAAGREAFVVMVALVAGRETRMSWIYDPVGDRMALAEAGAGAWIDGVRLGVAAPTPAGPLPGALRGTLHGGRYGGPEITRRIEAARERLSPLRSLRCAGREYMRLAAGETHYTLFTKLMPWDHAPGVLLFREAGGVARLLDRRAYEAHIYEGPALLLAADDAAWEALHGLLAAG